MKCIRLPIAIRCTHNIMFSNLESMIEQSNRSCTAEDLTSFDYFRLAKLRTWIELLERRRESAKIMRVCAAKSISLSDLGLTESEKPNRNPKTCARLMLLLKKYIKFITLAICWTSRLTDRYGISSSRQYSSPKCFSFVNWTTVRIFEMASTAIYQRYEREYRSSRFHRQQTLPAFSKAFLS